MFRIRFVPAVIALALAGVIGATGQADAAVPSQNGVQPLPVSERTNYPTRSEIWVFDLYEESVAAERDGFDRTFIEDAFTALVETGGVSAINNGSDTTIYPHIGTVVEIPGGLATVTNFGIGICLDGAGERCSGGEYMTDAFLLPEHAPRS